MHSDEAFCHVDGGVIVSNMCWEKYVSVWITILDILHPHHDYCMDTHNTGVRCRHRNSCLVWQTTTQTVIQAHICPTRESNSISTRSLYGILFFFYIKTWQIIPLFIQRISKQVQMLWNHYVLWDNKFSWFFRASLLMIQSRINIHSNYVQRFTIR